MSTLTLVRPDTSILWGIGSELAAYADAVRISLQAERSATRLASRLRTARLLGAEEDVLADLQDRVRIYRDVEEVAYDREEAAHGRAWAVDPDTVCDIAGLLMACPRWWPAL